MSYVKFDNITKKYPYAQFAVFENLSFELSEKAQHTLLIDTQSGKTTICKLLMGLEKADSGQIFLKEKNIAEVKNCDKSIAYLGRDLLLFENRTAEQNILFPLKVRKIAKAQQMQLLGQVAKKFCLENLLKCKVKKLTDYQKLSVALARICLRKPDLLLFDGIFERVCDNSRQLLQTLVQQYDGTVVVLTSDSDYIFGQCLLISDSKIVASGNAEKIKAQQQKLLWLYQKEN